MVTRVRDEPRAQGGYLARTDFMVFKVIRQEALARISHIHTYNRRVISYGQNSIIIYKYTYNFSHSPPVRQCDERTNYKIWDWHD